MPDTTPVRTMPPPDLRIIDAHTHQWALFSDRGELGRFLDRNPELRWMILASDLQGGYYPTEDEIAASNASTLNCIAQFPDRISGYCYINPRHGNAVDEFRRGLDAGLVGLKLWVATRCSDPVTFPIVEAAIAADVPMLVHTWDKAAGNLADESYPVDMAALAQRYPEGRFLMAHFGGNWEWGLRAIASLPNVWADFSGTINEFGAYEMAVRVLGPDRVVFGSDLSADFWGNAGRVLQLECAPETRDRIFYRNFLDLLAPRHRERFDPQQIAQLPDE